MRGPFLHVFRSWYCIAHVFLCILCLPAPCGEGSLAPQAFGVPTCVLWEIVLQDGVSRDTTRVAAAFGIDAGYVALVFGPLRGMGRTTRYYIFDMPVAMVIRGVGLVVRGRKVAGFRMAGSCVDGCDIGRTLVVDGGSAIGCFGMHRP